MNKKMLLNAVVLCFITHTIIAQVPSNIPSNGLIGYWPFSGNANDVSGNNNNGTVNGASLTSDRFGNANSAYNFDGNDFISSNSFPLTGNSPRTVNFWFKKTLSNPDGTPISWGGNSQGQRFDCGIRNTSVSAGASNSEKVFSFNGIATNWNMYTVVLPNIPNPSVNDIVIYENGVQLSNVIYTFNVSTLINTASNTTLFFGKNNNSGNQSFLTGLLDDIGIWNRALSQEEITNIYNANQCITNITVTDTLIINVGQLSFNDPVTWANNITIAPNPASTEININFNTITNLAGGSINIINSLGQSVANTPITATGTQTTMQLSVWGGTGMYFVQIINAQGQIVDIKKIILQ